MVTGKELTERKELEQLAVEQEKHRQEEFEKTRKKIERVLKVSVISAIRKITTEEWEQSEEKERKLLGKRLNWQVEMLDTEFSDSMRLVHLAGRMDSVGSEDVRKELLQQRINAYEDELTLQAARVGCGARAGLLNDGVTLSRLHTASASDSESIANTYNYDLARAIKQIKLDVPRANRHTYAKRLGQWETTRREVKSKQITENTVGTARALAQSDFYTFNLVEGVAILEPGGAVCPICQGWINRGEVPIAEAKLNPPPYHINCPHFFVTMPNRIAPGECDNLWMGG